MTDFATACMKLSDELDRVTLAAGGDGLTDEDIVGELREYAQRMEDEL